MRASINIHKNRRQTDDKRRIFERLNKVFQEVFDDETIEVNDDTTSEDIDDLGFF